MTDPANVYVISIDFGDNLTESCFADLASGVVHRVENYPSVGGTKSGTKVPSCLKYDSRDPSDHWKHWGWWAKEYPIEPGLEPFEGFKRAFLKPDPNDTPAWEQRLSKRSDEILRRFLDQVYRHIIKQITDSRPPGQAIDLNHCYFFFGIPARYNTDNNEGTKRLEAALGFDTEFAFHKDRTEVGPDTEAAFFYFKQRDPDLIKVGDCFRVIDTGADEIDVDTLELDKDKPVVDLKRPQAKEIKVVAQSGSSAVDSRFMKDMIDKIMEPETKLAYRDSPEFKQTIESFRALKREYSSDQSLQGELKMRIYPTNLPHKRNNNGYMTLTSAEMKQFVHEPVRNLFDSTDSGFRGEELVKCKAIFCTGGMGSTRWFVNLMNLELQKLGPRYEHIKVPWYREAGSAVCLGALERGLHFLRHKHILKHSILFEHNHENTRRLQVVLKKGMFIDPKNPLDLWTTSYKLPQKEANAKKKPTLKFYFHSGDVDNLPNSYNPAKDDSSQCVLHSIDLAPLIATGSTQKCVSPQRLGKPEKKNGGHKTNQKSKNNNPETIEVVVETREGKVTVKAAYQGQPPMNLQDWAVEGGEMGG